MRKGNRVRSLFPLALLVLVCARETCGEILAGPSRGTPAPQGWVDVKQYGAIDDGVTDSTGAIIDALAATSTGGILFFPPTAAGYVVGNVPVMKKVEFWGYGVTLKASGASGAIFLPGAGSDGSRWSGFAFNGNERTRAIDIVADTTELVIAFNSFDENFKGNAIRLGDAVVTATDVVIEHNVFAWKGITTGGTGPLSDAIILANFQSDRLIVRANRFILREARPSMGLMRGIFVQGASGANIVGNFLSAPAGQSIQQVGTPIAVWGAGGVGAPKYGTRIIDNEVVGGWGNQIYLNNAVVGALIRGNVIRDWNANGGAGGITIGDHCDHAIVSANVVRNGTNNADGVWIARISRAAPAYVSVTGNEIVGNSRNGFAGGGAWTNVTGNVFRDNTSGNVSVQATGQAVEIHDNVIGGVGGGLTDKGINTRFHDNRVSSSGGFR
jgi:Pectate lyase superfamily protein